MKSTANSIVKTWFHVKLSYELGGNIPARRKFRFDDRRGLAVTLGRYVNSFRYFFAEQMIAGLHQINTPL